jgi:ATP:ADP antiporter, AAA family
VHFQFIVNEATPDRGSVNSRTSLEKVLSLFAEVRRGEGLTSLLLMANVLTVLTAYYLIKPVREALILSSQGAEIKTYTGAVQAMLFLLIVPLYSSFASRVDRLRLINGVAIFFLTNLFIFFAVGRAGVDIGIPFFIWVGLFNVMLPAQIWALANDIYTEEQGKRLFAITGIGSSMGAIFGAFLAGRLVEPLGPYRMMLVSAAVLGVSIVLTTSIHRRRTRSDVANRRQHEAPIGGAGGFQLIFRHRYLFLIAIMVLLTNLVNTTGEFILGKVVKDAAQTAVASGVATEENFIGKFYADFYFWVNLLGAMLQLFVVSRLMKYAGISLALMVLPLIALGSYSLLAVMPVLSLVRFVKIFENSTDYSIQNTARHALFLNTGRDAKYKAKTAIDNFFWRAGDGFAALLVFIGTQLAFGLRGFALVNSILVLAWLATVLGIRHVRKNRSQESLVQENAA